MKIQYTIWAGGSEINNYLIETLSEAERISHTWVARGYDDVIIEMITQQLNNA